MPGFTSEQVATLQGYINAANAALSAGDTQNALNYINLYYSSQTDIRGYGTDALDVINNQGRFGAVANQEVIDAIGATQFANLHATLQVQVATADMALIAADPSSVPTSDQIAD